MRYAGGYFWPDCDERMVGIYGYDARSSIEHQEAQAAEIAQLVPAHKRKYAIQAGAQFGHFARIFAKLFTHVFAFEADPQQYECALLNTRYDANISLRQCALGYTGAKMAFEHHPTHCGKSRIVPENPTSWDFAYDFGYDRPIEVQMMPLDTFYFPGCELLQLDIEGFELYAMQGGEKMIKHCKPVIVLEINKACEKYGIYQCDIENWLGERGYAPDGKCREDFVYRFKGGV